MNKKLPNEKLTPQELHNLAMNIVGDDLKAQGFEFMGVNSNLKKDPQFVALKDKILHFVIVRAVSFPQEVRHYDPTFMETIKTQAEKFKAKTYYAGVGLGHGTDYGKPVIKDEDYTLLYFGLDEVL